MRRTRTNDGERRRGLISSGDWNSIVTKLQKDANFTWSKHFRTGTCALYTIDTIIQLSNKNASRLDFRRSSAYSHLRILICKDSKGNEWHHQQISALAATISDINHPLLLLFNHRLHLSTAYLQKALVCTASIYTAMYLITRYEPLQSATTIIEYYNDGQ